jgi:signal transduction histidine kinase
LIVAAFFLTRADETSLVVAASDRGFTVLAIWAAVVLIVRWKGWATRSGRINAHRRASLRALGVQPEALDDVAAGHLVSSQEDERRHLASELQRDLAPRLATAVLDIRALRGGASNATELLRSVEGQLAELKKDFLRFADRLYPSALNRLDLVEAIEAECRSVEEQSGLWLDFESRNVPRTLPEEAAVCLYRVCQESLRNVSKHSKADEAKVLLEADEDGLTLVVSDSGVGFDPETTMGGMGLLGMRERARLAGGTFEVRSRPGAGTEAAAFVPIAWADEGLAAAAGA